MTTLPASAAAQAYLKRLTALTESLPSSEQLDLLTGIEEHLRDAEQRGVIQAALDSLGPPEQIALEAGAETAGTPRWMRLLAVASAVATVGGFMALGALLCFTAYFDDDSEYALHPMLILLAFGAGSMTGVFSTVLSFLVRELTGQQRVLLTASWIASSLLAIVFGIAGGSVPVGVNLPLSALPLLMGAIGVVLVLRYTAPNPARKLVRS